MARIARLDRDGDAPAATTSPPVEFRSTTWRGKGVVRSALFFAAAAAIAALASTFGITYDYRYLRTAFLSGVPGGQYHTLATHLSERAREANGRLTVVATEGSLENINRLSEAKTTCAAAFALVQDGTPAPANGGLQVLGRLPKPEALLLLARRDHSFRAFDNLRAMSIGIGPENSGTAHLVRKLFEDPDLSGLNARLTHHTLDEQAAMVAEGRLDLAAMVMREDADLVRNIVRKHDLDVSAPGDLEGLVARHPWLSLGRIPAGLYDLVRPTPSADRPVARVDTLILANSCARRAERVALLMLLNAELPGFVRANPPKSTEQTTGLPLATEARQFFQAGEPELADRYFPWLVNLMSPTYWVYLVMAVTILFNAMKALSRFRLWRIDAAREKLVAGLPDKTPLRDPDRALAVRTLDDLTALRTRCQRQVASMATPMGDEMFYRYQQHRIESAVATLEHLLKAPGNAGAEHQPPASQL